MDGSGSIDDVLARVGPRLKRVRTRRDVTLAELAAEFDTRVLHWFGAANEEPVEVLSLLSREGERIHVRARPRRGPDRS